MPADFLRRGMRFTTLGEARRAPFTRFVKPVDEKQFRAAVYASAGELPGPEVLKDGLPVVTAEPVRWLDEYRCFVLEGRVVTASPYAWKGEREDATGVMFELDQGRAFAEEVLASAGEVFPPAVVLDVGRIEGRGRGGGYSRLGREHLRLRSDRGAASVGTRLRDATDARIM